MIKDGNVIDCGSFLILILVFFLSVVGIVNGYTDGIVRDQCIVTGKHS